MVEGEMRSDHPSAHIAARAGWAVRRQSEQIGQL